VKNKRERSMSVSPPGVEQTSRLGSMDPMASKIKCGTHGGKNNNTKSCTVSLLSLKTKVEARRHGSRVMSGDWRVAIPILLGLQWFTTKPLGCLAEPKTQCGCEAKTGLTGLESQGIERL
jgi:hypothetical protein